MNVQHFGMTFSQNNSAKPPELHLPHIPSTTDASGSTVQTATWSLKTKPITPACVHPSARQSDRHQVTCPGHIRIFRLPASAINCLSSKPPLLARTRFLTNIIVIIQLMITVVVSRRYTSSHVTLHLL